MHRTKTVNLKPGRLTDQGLLFRVRRDFGQVACLRLGRLQFGLSGRSIVGEGVTVAWMRKATIRQKEKGGRFLPIRLMPIGFLGARPLTRHHQAQAIAVRILLIHDAHDLALVDDQDAVGHLQDLVQFRGNQ